jgi:hypothetical protein
MNETTITILGRDVRVRYCAATETSFEEMTGKSIDVFIPTVENDEVKEPAKANRYDYLMLAIGGIIAAYLREQKDAPITTDEILYDASPTEVMNLITTILNLRNEWYKVADIVPEEEGNGKGKN